MRGLPRMHLHGRAPLRYSFQHDLFQHDLDRAKRRRPSQERRPTRPAATASADTGCGLIDNNRLCARTERFFRGSSIPCGHLFVFLHNILESFKKILRRWKCWRGFTPKRGAIAMHSMSCATQ